MDGLSVYNLVLSVGGKEKIVSLLDPMGVSIVPQKGNWVPESPS